MRRLVVLLLLTGCVRAPTIEAQTPASVQVFGTMAQPSADMAQRHCAQHGRDAALRSEVQPMAASPTFLRTYDCVPR